MDIATTIPRRMTLIVEAVKTTLLDHSDLFLSGVTAFFLNALVLLTMSRHRHVSNTMDLYVGQLAVIDFIQAVLVHPMSIVSAFAHKWIFGKAGTNILTMLELNENY